ncbi:MAG: helix-turn-helix transcriptional regulator [Candidatus Lokiarchaeota archaeon]|nr:helix-turn-helix transcriptional regulator [Candidatus Lokiarchaeota archaeon]
MKTRIKEFREEKSLTQKEFADIIGVSRQTIYFLEKGDYNPSLTLSFKIAELLDKPLNQIFYLESLIKIKIESLSLKELKNIASNLNIKYDKLVYLSEIDENHILKEFNKDFLRKISNELEMTYEDLFDE